MDDPRCIAPAATTLDDLMSWADEEASTAVVAHVASCRVCQETATEYRQIGVRLSSILNRVDCPDAGVLVDYAYDLLAPEQRTVVAAHILDCTRCTGDLRDLRDEMAAPAVPQSERTPIVEQIVATIGRLLPPLPQLPLRASTRGVRTRAATYDAESLQISIEATVANASGSRDGDSSDVTVRGMVMLADADDDESMLQRSRVDLLDQDDGALILSTNVDQFGMFLLAHIQPGVYDLQVSLPDRAVLIKDLWCRVDA